MRINKPKRWFMGLLLVHSTLFSSSAFAASDWFISKDLYTMAHKELLEDDTAAVFQTIIQAWQQSPNSVEANNLDQLLNLAISEDCGHSLERKVLPTWLPKLSIERQAEQNLNQQLLKISVVGLTRSDITNISLTKWPNKPLLRGAPFIDDGGYFSVESQRLDEPVSAGLYKLSITAVNKPAWVGWIVLTTPADKQEISWKDSKTWRIDNINKNSGNCPAPTLSIKLYDLNDTTWHAIWSQESDSDWPTTLPKLNFPEGRYWLSVGVVKTRWQGEISILDIQRITRPVDYVGDDDEDNG
ncbi:DUF2861 family protein [Photobacterium piscicola]|uniref:DUF2861 family protein n=1 Tax=Photobacterium piscicola TaxID=1378299 RepID=A0ABU6LG66_9GAMM|nr:DUF2861 family protein [Photobacterium piscicola]